jgi:hypothetical protein
LVKATFKHLALDTSDWLERFVAAGICKRDGKSDIEDYGYGKGYVTLENELVKILAKLDELRDKGMGIIILSHVKIKTFTDPRGEVYDRYEMKGHQRWTGILREWPDAVLFANITVFKTKIVGTAKEKAIAGERLLHTIHSPAYDAKNRLNLPETVPMDWDALAQAIKDNSNESLRAKVKALFATAKIEDAARVKWDAAMKRLNELDAQKLKSAIEKLTQLQPA